MKGTLLAYNGVCRRKPHPHVLKTKELQKEFQFLNAFPSGLDTQPAAAAPPPTVQLSKQNLEICSVCTLNCPSKV